MEYISLLLIALTVVSSIKGFGDAAFFDRLKFHVGAILGKNRQWDRLITSAFLHADYMHLFFNMLTLYFFSNIVIQGFGTWQYLAIYFGAVIGGGLLSLWMHKDEYTYSAIGASGGVVGILFASIAIDPHIPIYFFFIPIPIPGWIFAFVYLGFSIYGMRTRAGNIGHDAHLGGAAVGLLLSLLMAPHLLFMHTLYIAILIVPLIVLGYYAWKQKNK